MTSGSPQPEPVGVQYRIGDAERDAAIERLRVAHTEGRITVSEFDERMSAALQARTQADLAPLFADLPAPGAPVGLAATPPSYPAPTLPRPADPVLGATASTDTPQDVAVAEPQRQGGLIKPSSRLWGLYGALWPITLVICFATDWRLWWLVFIPGIVSTILFGPAAGGAKKKGKKARG